jgi:hypothetical protein
MVEQINPAEQLAASGTPSSTTYLRGDNTWSTPSGGSGSTTPTANTGAEWDSNLNLSANNFLEQMTSQATSATTLTLTIASDAIQVFTGTTQTQLVTLPTTSVPEGGQWLIVNQTTAAAVTVQSSGANTILVLAPGTAAVFTANVATPTTAANWGAMYGGVAVATGKSLTVSNSLTFTGTDGTSFTFPAVTGNAVAPPTKYATATSTAAIAVNTTQVTIASVLVPASTAAVGTAFKIHGWGTTSSTTTGALTWEIHCGSLNTTADAVVASGSCQMAASLGSSARGLLTIRATSATTGSCMASITCFGNATSTVTTSAALSAVAAAINAVMGHSTQTANVTYTNSAAAYVSLSVAASAGTFNLQNAYVAYAGA